MKKMILIIAVLLMTGQLFSQDASKTPLIGDKAPSFTAKTTSGTLNFPDDYGTNWKILLSHPQDFTPVCSSEILELANLQSKFDKLGVKVAVISTDPLESHKQWKSALESLNYKNMNKIEISFPIIDDEKIEISRKYGMIQNGTNSTKAVRGVFVIDPENTIQSVSFYPMRVGRNLDEIVRLVEALQATSSGEYLAPGNWASGDDMMVPYLPDLNKKDLESEGYYSLAWFMLFKTP